MMKDILDKLTELQAAATKASAKKKLTEDTSKRTLAKKPSLKDVFNELSESIPPGQKPLPVMDPTNKKAGMGFVTSNNPAVQNMLKNLDPKDVQIVQAPGAPGQTQAQPNTIKPVGTAGATQGGQGQAMGAGQQAVQEKDEGKPGKNFAKIAKSAGARYGSKEAGERVAGAVRAKLAKQGKLEEEPVEESGLQAYLGNKKYGKDGMDALRKAGRNHVGKEKMSNIRAKYDKMDEADIPSTAGVDTKGAGLGAGRSATTLESKKGVNPFPKKDDKAPAKSSAKGKKPDFLDLDKDGDKKEPMKKAVADKKKKVKESMNHRINAARHEGRSHGLRGNKQCGKSYDDLEEMRAYHEGYKEGLDECYGQGVYEAAPAMPPATVGGMANQELDEISSELASRTLGKRQERISRGMDPGGPKDFAANLKSNSALMARAGLINHPDHRGPNDSYANEAEFDEGNAFSAALAKTPKGGKFSVGGKAFTDRSNYDSKLGEGDFAFESWNNQLKALVNESEVNEGLSVSISKGQQNSPDSVTITAQDAEADELLAFVKQAGLGIFGADKEPSSAMSIQPAHGAADEIGAGGAEIGVVDGHDGMMGLMQKLSGIQSNGAEDYADEEGDEEQLYGNHQTADKKDCGCDGDCECSDYDKPSNEGTCNECGGMMEAGHSCGGKEVVDEVESEDQMEFEVAEANAPDTGADNTNADVAGQVGADKALAVADAGQDKEDGMSDQAVQESDDEDEDKDVFHNPNVPADKQLKAPPKEINVKESFMDLYKKLAFLSEESDEAEDEKAEKAGKKVTKDIEYDDKKDKKEKVDEWANNAGPGKTVSDTTFEQDIDFMTKVISGGLNKQKSTGQTTIPVIPGQDNRMHNNPMDWATLAGIKK